MSKIIWDSNKDKYEAIGYLAKPGVVACIEATVPKDKLKKFKEEYDGRFSNEFPYITEAKSKFGYQFRIYLQDTEGCPDFLAKQLDDKYKRRINDTTFIKELVLNYGFRFTHQPQDSYWIDQIVSKATADNYNAFKKGYYVYENFIHSLTERMKLEELPDPIFSEPKISAKKGKRKVSNSVKIQSLFTTQQLQSMGWIGEEYIYRLLSEKNKKFLDKLKIKDGYTIEWFNNGYKDKDLSEWTDMSIGHGCDIVLSEGDRRTYIEVKSSKRKSPLFTMTSKEMRLMKKEKQKYYVVKLDYLERLLRNKSPEIIILDKPYDRYFAPDKMKEATFVIGE